MYEGFDENLAYVFQISLVAKTSQYIYQHVRRSISGDRTALLPKWLARVSEASRSTMAPSAGSSNSLCTMDASSRPCSPPPGMELSVSQRRPSVRWVISQKTDSLGYFAISLRARFRQRTKRVSPFFVRGPICNLCRKFIVCRLGLKNRFQFMFSNSCFPPLRLYHCIC